jgi:O-antigen/teichoic acid export membrane protein
VIARNLFANYSGQVWAALMGFAFVPFYVRHLGVEAYGVIGVFGAFLAWLTLLDAGLKPAIGREMARFTGGAIDPESTWDLLRSVEWVCLAVALIICGATLAASGWLATSWVKAEGLKPQAIAEAISYMGFIAAMKFVEGVYSSCLSGMQRHVSMNAVAAGLATIRATGALAVLVWVDNSLSAFFQWQLAISIFSTVLYRHIAYRAMPVPRRPPRFALMELQKSWRFAGGMLMLTFLGLLLTQIDKLLLSTLISLEDFGRYTLASLAAGALFTLISPISVTFLPRLTQLHAAREDRAFATTFHRGAQLVAVVGGGVAATLIFNSEAALLVWLQDRDLARQTSALLSLLLLGNLMNGLCHMPYQALLAHGKTRPSILINAVAALILIPLIFLLVPHHGAVGAAAIWATLNLGYLVAFAFFVFGPFLTAERSAWIVGDVFKPVLFAVVVAAAGRELMPEGLDTWPTIAFLVVLMAIACMASLLGCKELRHDVLHGLRAKSFPFLRTK